MKVKVFPGDQDQAATEKAVNDWLASHNYSQVIDIKYGYAADFGSGWYSAMIIYQE